MAITRHYGCPTFFITLTANPRWVEIVAELLPGQTAVNRPDLVARIFHMKQQAFLRDLRHQQVLERFIGYSWTIEYQKRGLPHMHLLLFLHPDDQFITPDPIDQVVSAEIPDPTFDLSGELTNIIRGNMIHGPCGPEHRSAPCMQSPAPGLPKACVKRYPQSWEAETSVQ